MSWIITQLTSPSGSLNPMKSTRRRRARRDEEFERTVAQLREEERLRAIRRETEQQARWYRRWFK
jgi:hypothetical protein